MKRALLLAAIVVLCCSPLAMAVNSIVIADQSVSPGQTGVVVPIKLTNDTQLRTVQVVLILRDVNPGGFPTQATVSYGDRLPAAFGNPLSGIVLGNQYDSGENGACQGPGHGFGTPDFDTVGAPHPITNSPWGVLYFRSYVFPALPLVAGADVTGSLLLTLNMGGSDGTFEIDTSCTDPSNHTFFVTDPANQTIVPTFSKATITVGTGGGGGGTPPNALCTDVTLPADGNCQVASVDPALIDAGSNDNEDGTNLNFQVIPGGPYSLGENFVRLLVTDQDGDTASCGSIITVADSTAPSVTCELEADTLSADQNCEASLPGYFNIGIDDNCSNNFSTSQNPPQGTPLAVGGPYTVWTIVDDNNGNKDSCSFTVLVVDDTPPVIASCPNDTTVQCQGDIPAPDIALVNASDNCSAVTVTWTGDDDTNFDPCGGTIVRTYHIEDESGNAVECTQTFTIDDTTDPVITVCPNDTTVQCEADVPPANLAAVTATDNCGAPSITHEGDTPLSPDACGGTITRTYRATDACGNFVECTQTITVKDDTKPEITCPADVEVPENGPGQGVVVTWTAPGSTDNCGSPTVSQVAGPPSGSTFNVGPTDISYESVDDCGNADTCTFTITVTAVGVPVAAVCVQGVTFDADANCEAALAPADLDGGSTGPIVNRRLNPEGPYALGPHSVWLVVDDGASDIDSCEATFTVEDNTPPEIISCPNDTTVQCEADVPAANSSLVGATDACGGVTVTFMGDTPLSPDACGGTITRTYRVADDVGNFVECQQTFTVDDNTRPEILCPVNVNVPEDGPGQGAVVTWSDPGATDNCAASPTVTQIAGPPSGSTFPVGPTDVSYEAVDDCGNADTCTFTVTVNEVGAPVVAVCVQGVTFDADANCGADLAPADLDGGSTGPIVNRRLNPEGPYDLGPHSVWLVVDDGASDIDSCEATFTVEDNTPPSIQCTLGDQTAAADQNCEYELPEYGLQQNINLEDNCPLADAVTQNPPVGTIVGLGDHTIWLIATDGAGNQDSCSFQLTVEDIFPPVIQCAGTMVVENAPNECGQDVVFDGWATATDNCGVESLTYDPPAGFFPVGTTLVTATAVDASGNSASCQFGVEVNDTQRPTVQCPNDIEEFVACGENGKNVEFLVTTDDNCSATLDVQPPSESFFPLGQTLVTAIATDPSGNKDTCTFTVTVTEQGADLVVAKPDTLYFSAIAGGANPADQAFDVTNQGCNPVDFQVEELIPWASANPLLGTTDDQVDVSVDITGLGADTYWGTMYVGRVPSKGILVDDSVVICLTVESQCDNAKVQADVDTLTITVGCFKDEPDLCTWIHFDSDTPGCVLGWTTYYDDSTFIAGLTPGHGVTPDSALLCFNVLQLEPGDYFECIQVYQTVLPPGSKILADDQICIKVHVEDCGQEPEASVTVGDTCGVVGDTVTVPVSYCTNFDASGLSVGIGYDPSLVQVLGVAFNENCVGGIDEGELTSNVDDVNGTICLLALPAGNDPLIAAGCCDLATITFVITSEQCPTSVALELLNVPIKDANIPLCGTLFTDDNQDPVWPTFDDGSICIRCPDLCGEICGTVFGPDPLPGVTVALQDSLGNVIATTATDANGNFCFSGLPDGAKYWVHVDVPGFCDYLEFTYSCCPEKGGSQGGCGALGVILKECPDVCEICISVYEVTGAPLENAWVELWSSYPDGVILDSCLTKANAYCCFEDVAAGQQYEVRVRKSGYCPQIFTVECDQKLLPVVLDKLPVIPTQPYAADWYSQNSTVEGVPLVPGDVIIAMDPDGVICGVTEITTPGEYFIHVIGDDGTTVGQDEGADPGDEITLYYNCECPLIADGLWQPLSSNEFDAAFDCSRRTVEIPLCDDWTLISFNVLPPSPAVDDVLKSIDGDYQFLLSATCADGNISWDKDRPAGLNDLQTMDACHGYWVKPVGPAVGPIVIEGVPVAVDKPLYLCPGWNAISYLPDEDDERAHALASIDGQYEHVFTATCDGIQSWDENRPAELNDLYCLMPTKGYWIKMKEEATQTYPLSGYSCPPPPSGFAKPVNLSERVHVTPRYADFWSATDVSTTDLTPGDRITAKTESGLIVGEALVNDRGWFLLHVYGDDPTTKAVDGAQAGEKLAFEVNGVTAASTGNTAWTERQSSEITVFAAGGNPVPAGYALLQNYPNPFNPSTTIQYRLKDATNVNLTIYNVLGQSVRTLVSRYEEAGTHTVEWDGRSDNGSTVQSGIYFYRLETPSFTEAKKMTLLK